MAEFASNTPISRPINNGWNADADLNGMLWSNDWGMFFPTADELIPISLPPNVARGG